MRILLFFVAIILSFQHAISQEVQWVSTILEASSELSPREYSAEQIIGKPNVTPGTGDSPNAWMPSRDDREEYVKVGFETPFRIRQVAIAESMNPLLHQLSLLDRHLLCIGSYLYQTAIHLFHRLLLR